MLTWKDVLSYAETGTPPAERKVVKSDAEWRAELSPDAYRVTRHAATEAPFSSDICSVFKPGIYACVCCGTVLFDASQKFESGTGWPSFTQPVQPNVVGYVADHSHGMTRIEAICNVCDGHLGHVFPDGPAPSRLRYCMNGLALTKV